MDKSNMKDSKGRYITQSLFLELGYNTELAQFTFDDKDKKYEGKIYPSIKRLYIEYADPVEYDFANEYFLGWQHWKRLCGNAQIAHHIEQWREELELSIRGEGVRSMITQATDKDSFQAAKFLVDRGWDKRSAGRPSKEEKEKRLAQEAKLQEEYGNDIAILETHKKG